MTAAHTILEQLGGNKFIAMTGCGAFGYSNEGRTLSMKLSRNESGATHLMITLTDSDTYDVEFIKITRKLDRITVKEVKGAYADMLQPIFTKTTGFDTTI